MTKFTCSHRTTTLNFPSPSSANPPQTNTAVTRHKVQIFSLFNQETSAKRSSLSVPPSPQILSSIWMAPTFRLYFTSPPSNLHNYRSDFFSRPQHYPFSFIDPTPRFLKRLNRLGSGSDQPRTHLDASPWGLRPEPEPSLDHNDDVCAVISQLSRQDFRRRAVLWSVFFDTFYHQTDFDKPGTRELALFSFLLGVVGSRICTVEATNGFCVVDSQEAQG